MVTKQDRLRVFFERLKGAKPASTHDDAVALFENSLNGVEDDWSGAPFDLSKSPQDGRMYPPLADNVRVLRNSTGRSIGTRRFSTAHTTFITDNGAIKIVTRADGATNLDNPGHDGKRVDEQ